MHQSGELSIMASIWKANALIKIVRLLIRKYGFKKVTVSLI